MTALQQRTKELEDAHLDRIQRATDRQFLWLTIIEFVGAVLAAIILGPKTYVGSASFIHPHVIVALVLGALIAGPVVFVTLAWPGQFRTRVTVAVCQMLMSALLIHISGGRIETHFHVFGTLAFLSFYRDWRILIPATVVVAGDHIVRGIYLPESVYGVVAGAEWRFLEHAAWVVFEDIILIAACLRGIKEMHLLAERQATLETTNERIEAAVSLRTRELMQTELQKSAVFENALDGIVSADQDGNVIEINPAAARILCVDRVSVVGTSMANLFAPGDPAHVVADGIREFTQTGAGKLINKSVELSAVSEKGELVPVEVAMFCVHVNGAPVFTAFVRDISERKRLHENLAHSSKMQSLGELATGVAHEINTPNQYIGDNVRFIEESFAGVAHVIEAYRTAVKSGGPTPEQAEEIARLEAQTDLTFVMEQIPPALNQALEGVERVGSIITAMKVFAHPGVGSYTEVDVNRVIDSTVKVARNEWKYVADLHLDLEPDLPMVQGHTGELSQVVLNLVVNAAQAIQSRFNGTEKGQILVSTRLSGEKIVVTVTDNGCGIPSPVLDRIFDPFFTTKGVGVGTGQGLAITRSVVERHRGEVVVRSREGAGTTFTLKLPIGAPKQEEVQKSA